MRRFLAILSGVLLLCLFGCGRASMEPVAAPPSLEPTAAPPPAQPEKSASTEKLPATAAPRESDAPLYDNLLSWAENEAEAEEIAAQYGIEFISYAYNVATYHTDEDPRPVIARGKQNGWPELSLNGMNYAFEGEAKNGSR